MSKYLSGRDFADWLAVIEPPGGVGIAVYQVAIDESGSHKHALGLTMGACIATARQWKLLTKDWRPVASRYPHGYHASGARHADNLALAALIDRRADASTAVTITYADYQAAVPQKDRSKLGTEYLAAMKTTVGWLHLVLEYFNVPRMALIVERGHTKGGAAAEQYLSAALNDPVRFRIASVVWVGKEDLLTHAADLIAHVYAGNRDDPENAELRTILNRQTNTLCPSRAELVETTHTIRKQLSEYRRWLRQQNKAEQE